MQIASTSLVLWLVLLIRNVVRGIRWLRGVRKPAQTGQQCGVN